MNKLIIYFFALSALCFLNSCHADSKDSLSASPSSLKEAPFPSDLQYLNKPLYDLIDSGNFPDTIITQEVKRLLKATQAKDKLILKKLMSGPEPKGKYIVTPDKNKYVYFEACQVHECNTTTMALLYDVQHKKAVGLLRLVCEETWLGMEGNDSRKSLLKELLPDLDDSDKSDCNAIKSEK